MSGEEAALAHVLTSVPTATPTERVDAVRARITAGTFDSVDWTWVLDDGRLTGVVGIGVLLRAEADVEVGSLATAAPPSVDVDIDQERVAHHAIAESADPVPVTREGRFLGVVPARALLEVLHREHAEDLHRLVGIAPARGSPAARNALHRLPWLIVGLAGSLLASGIMGGFEETLRRDLAIAFFVPVIVYVADAVGTQTEALVVRGLAVGHGQLDGGPWRELGTGALLGIVLGCLAAPAVGLLWGNMALGYAVGISVFVACSVATGIGMALPWALSFAGMDPAFGSGPLATIVQDVLSILVYLSVVQVLVV